MKYLRLFLSLLLCFALLSGAFSFTANAEEVEKELYIKVHGQYRPNLSTIYQTNGVTYGDSISREYVTATTYNEGPYSEWFSMLYVIYSPSDELICKSDEKFTISIQNQYSYWHFENSNGYSEDLGNNLGDIKHVKGRVLYSDGTYSDYGEASVDFSNQKQSFNFTFENTASKDVEKIYIKENFLAPTNWPKGEAVHMYLYHSYGTDVLDDVVLDVQSEEAGLLSGILGWIQNIFNTVEDTWKVVTAGFANVVQGITDLPQKIWDFIENGLKSLFVPDTEYMESYSDKWDELLSSRLGAVYQVCSIVTDSWDEIMNASETSTVNMPSVSIPLPDGNSFTFGGYDVNLIPEGFSGFVTLVKYGIAIVCTYLFVNGLLKRYDEVIGGKS